MRLTVNGETREAPDQATLTDLLASLGIDGRRVAVERNREMPLSSGSQKAEGDQLEIVQCGEWVMGARHAPGPVVTPGG
jgi:thiamine biosynthesis protein ThiS